MMYRGKPLDRLTKKELIEAIQVLQHYYQAMESLHEKQLELAKMRYTPKTWLGRLIRRLT